MDPYQTLTQRGRRRFFLNASVPKIHNKQILEIGSLNAPTFTKESANVFFADYLSQEELKEHYPLKADGIHEVDYILTGPDPYKRVFDRVFNVVIANHVAEHIPDLGSWLQDLSSLCSPDGFLFLAVPDRRFTFDIARSESTIGEIIENYRDKITVPRFRSIFDHLYLFRKITAKDVWGGADLSVAKMTSRMSCKDAMKRAEAMYGKFHSLHCNIFTYQSFLQLIATLHQSGLTDWEHIHSMDVQINGNEFLVLLGKRLIEIPLVEKSFLDKRHYER